MCSKNFGGLLIFEPQFLGKHKGESNHKRWPPTRKSAGKCFNFTSMTQSCSNFRCLKVIDQFVCGDKGTGSSAEGGSRHFRYQKSVDFFLAGMRYGKPCGKRQSTRAQSSRIVMFVAYERLLNLSAGMKAREAKENDCFVWMKVREALRKEAVDTRDVWGETALFWASTIQVQTLATLHVGTYISL